MSIGTQIALYRKSIKMTQDELGKLVGVSNQAVSKWETEITLPDILLLPKIAKALNVTLERLYETTETTENKVLVDDFPEYAYNIIVDEFYKQSKVKFNIIDATDNAQISFWKSRIDGGCRLKCISDRNGAVIINKNIAFIDKSYKKAGSEKTIESNSLAKALETLSDKYVRKIFVYLYKESFANQKNENNIKFTISNITNACRIEEEIVETTLEKMTSINLIERVLTDDGITEYYFKKATAIYMLTIYRIAEFLISDSVWLVERDTSEVCDYAFEKLG